METPNPEIKKDDEIGIEFFYDKELESARVRETVSQRAFFEAHNYGISLPKYTNYDNLNEISDNELEKMIIQGMDQEQADATSKVIQDCWRENQTQVSEFFKGVGAEVAPKFKVVFTQYGVGGSYIPPDTIIINIKHKHAPHPFENFVHEAVHCLIEDSIVKKYKLSQAEKESIVDYLMVTSPAVRAACPDAKYHRFGPPSEELLRKVGLANGQNEL